MASETPININITKDMGGQENNQYNEFKDYIIKNNIILQEENKNHIETITSLKEKIETYEEAEDKYDNRMRYMKGLLQNLNELKKDYNKITLKTEEKNKNSYNFNKTIIKLYRDIFYILICSIIIILFIIFTISILNIIFIIFNTILIVIITYGLLTIKNKYKQIKNEIYYLNNNNTALSCQIIKIKEEIKRAEDACLSLDNWICEV
jgi:cell division septum initiation protein DivIVA